MPHIAVITGDLIGSTEASDPAAFRGRLAELLQLTRERSAAQTTQYRGDGFQIAMNSDFNAFEAALILRTGLIAQSPGRANRWDARVAIAFGEGRVSDTDQNSQAYVNSGRALDGMEKDHLLTYAESDVLGLAMRAATGFADDIINEMTPTEAEVLFYYFLNRESHSSIAERLGKKRPTITAALQRAKYTLLDRYVLDMDKLVNLHGT